MVLGKVGYQSWINAESGLKCSRGHVCIPMRTLPAQFIKLMEETCIDCQPAASIGSYLGFLYAYSACDIAPTLLISDQRMSIISCGEGIDRHISPVPLTVNTPCHQNQVTYQTRREETHVMTILRKANKNLPSSTTSTHTHSAAHQTQALPLGSYSSDACIIESRHHASSPSPAQPLLPHNSEVTSARHPHHPILPGSPKAVIDYLLLPTCHARAKSKGVLHHDRRSSRERVMG